MKHFCWVISVTDWKFLQAGITLKKPQDDTEGTLTEAELFDVLDNIYTFCFLDVEAGQVLKLQNKVETQIKQLMDHIEANVSGSIIKRVCPTVNRHDG